MSKIMVQARKEWMEFRRDRLSLALALLLPLFSLMLFGYGIRLESKSIPFAVQDYDNTYVSREYVYRLFATGRIVPADWPATEPPASAIDRGIAKAGMIIPAGFSRHIFARESSPLQVFIDGTDISNSEIIINTIKGATASVAKIIAERAGQDLTEAVVPQIRIWFNPGRRETLFIVPGVFGVILWMYPALLAAVAASREKEQGTIIHVYSSRINALQLLLGKALVYWIIGLFLAVIVILLSWPLFQVRPIGDPLPLLIATPLYVLCSVLFGLLIGTLSNGQTTAVQATSTAGFFPCLLLSGFVYPVENIPFPLSLFSVIVPARYYIELCRDAFVRGIGWHAIWQDVPAIAAFCLVWLGTAWLGSRRMQLKD